MSSTPLIVCAALPFLWAYEVSCRARTGSVLHKVTLHERLVIRPVLRIRETGGSPASLTIPARATSADIGCQCADITLACFTNQPGHIAYSIGRAKRMRRISPQLGEMFIAWSGY